MLFWIITFIVVIASLLYQKNYQVVIALIQKFGQNKSHKQPKQKPLVTNVPSRRTIPRITVQPPTPQTSKLNE